MKPNERPPRLHDLAQLVEREGLSILWGHSMSEHAHRCSDQDTPLREMSQSACRRVMSSRKLRSPHKNV